MSQVTYSTAVTTYYLLCNCLTYHCINCTGLWCYT